MEWYRVIIEPESSGCGGIVGFICLILVIGLIVTMCGGSNQKQKNTNINPSQTQLSANQNMENSKYVEDTIPQTCGIESLHIFDEKGSIYFGNDPREDAYGKTHTGSYLSIWTLNNKSDEKNGYIGYIDLVTGNNYKTFSGVFFPRAEMRNEQTIELFIYADNELVYSSGVINRQAKPIEFNININQCDILRIEVFTVDYYYASTTGCASQLFIFDGKVSK